MAALEQGGGGREGGVEGRDTHRLIAWVGFYTRGGQSRWGEEAWGDGVGRDICAVV